MFSAGTIFKSTRFLASLINNSEGISLCYLFSWRYKTVWDIWNYSKLKKNEEKMKKKNEEKMKKKPLKSYIMSRCTKCCWNVILKWCANTFCESWRTNNRRVRPKEYLLSERVFLANDLLPESELVCLRLVSSP